MAVAEEIGMPVPVHPAYAVYTNTLWKIARFIYSGQLTIDQALSEGQKVINNHMNTLNIQKERTQ